MTENPSRAAARGAPTETAESPWSAACRSRRRGRFRGPFERRQVSALNAICDQQGLARTSKTPGRTQLLNVFAIGDGAQRLIDLPGYGYARVPEAMRLHWRGVIDKYLRERASLQGLVLVMDARAGSIEARRECDGGECGEFPVSTTSFGLSFPRVNNRGSCDDFDPICLGAGACGACAMDDDQFGRINRLIGRIILIYIENPKRG